MTSRQLTAVAMKVIALYICYTLLVKVPFYLRSAWLFLEDKIWGGISLSVFICIGGIVAWLTFKFANSLASDIRSAEPESVVPQFDRAQLEQVVFRVLGLYVFATHLRPVIDKAVYIQFKFYEIVGGSPDLYSQRVSLIVELIVMGFAISFILKPRFWQEKFKSWDSNKTVHPSQPSDAILTTESK